MRSVRVVWRGFRDLPGLIQVMLGIGLLLAPAVVTGADDRDVDTRSPTTTTTAAMVLDGYAVVATFPPNLRYVDRFVDFQRQAREANRGLWSRCGGADAPLTTTTSQALRSTPPRAGISGGGGCDPSYPGVCIPPAPPDLDCPDIPHRRFQVLPPYPHRFDGNDDDGLGCET